MKNKIIFILCSIFIFSFGVLFLSSNISNDVLTSEVKHDIRPRATLSMNFETDYKTGVYKETTDKNWPTSGYTFNAELSKCENGSEISWDDTNKKVIISGVKNDRCYVYFDALKMPTISVSVSNLPTTVGALATLNCSGATTTYSNMYNRIEISQISSKEAICSLNYINSPSKTTLANKVISLVGTTQGEGSIVQEKGYRYEGQDPNNYVWFNNELWRIIGVMDAESHGQTGLKLVKIIRNDPIGVLVLDKTNANDWNSSSLKSLLNTDYINSTNGTDGDNCYIFSSTIKTRCDYTTIGIKDAYRGMIKEVTWYLGGWQTNAITTAVMYGYERGTKVYTGRPTSGIGKIGLMYPSDFGYAAPSTNCARTTTLNSYNNDGCTLNNWLYQSGSERTISPGTTANYIFNIRINGTVTLSGGTHFGDSVRPSLYLDSSVYVIDGIGSKTDPFIIGM